MDIINIFLKQLEPLQGILIGVLIIAVVYLWREMVRLRDERNEIVKQKDMDLKAIAERKDADYRAITEKVIELQEKSINSNHELAIAANAQTEVGRVLIEGVKEVLNSVKK